MSNWIIYVDPGITNGIVVWYNSTLLIRRQLTFSEMVIWLDKILFDIMMDPLAKVTVGCERYVITVNSPKHADAAPTIMAWGAVKSAAVRAGAMFVDHQKSNVKNFVTDEMLKRLGWFQAGQRHSNDAARHTFYYLSEGGLLEPADVDKVMLLLDEDEEGSDDIGRYR